MNINMKSVVLIGIALVVAGITAMLARSLVSAPTPQLASDQPVVVQVVDSKMKVLVASGNMPVGHFIKADDLTWQSWPDETVHESYIQQGGDVKLEDFVGAVATTNMASGEPVLNNRLIKPGNRGFMAAVLPPGMRAISVRITATSGNAGFVFPGDKVDILLTHEVAINSANRDKARVSETVLKNVRVLAINQRTDNPTHTPSIGKTATLEVSAKDAEKISLIKSMGELTLVLRSIGNGSSLVAENSTITWDSEVSNQLSGSTNNAKLSVDVFRGGLKDGSTTIDFNKLMNQTMTSGPINGSGQE
ncbi:Flp pilus assembly protein RcpC/CpaB [hydrothermal vent metagenome]|uniref:Flp pilus assembly protein RcpC/CpaB n=1 Tax=hydrothermal vent metagenome TaxID=652676 RepID=A0A3B0RUF1_9ZZZZ